MTSEEIKTIRTKLGLSQSQLANKLGCAKSTVVRWENSQRPISNPYAQLLKQLVTGH